jgi:D-cysteine desulfhydrase
MPLVPELPSPVRYCPELSSVSAELWIKNDGVLHPAYGGNKVRKLPALLACAKARGARRVVTLGAAGSHHVLTTALFAREYGLRAAAVLGPQLGTEHASRVLRATFAQQIELFPIAGVSDALRAVSGLLRSGDYLIPPGGTGWLGAAAYADAVLELKRQIDSGELPEPDVIVVAFGSGGTAAGLLAGVIQQRLRSQISAVQVLGGGAANRLASLWLARGVLQRRGVEPRGLSARFLVTGSELGEGYGFPTESGERAARLARLAGIETEPTYTAKALAHALKLVERAPAGRRTKILYWHTLSAAPLEPLLSRAPALAALPTRIRRLLLPLPRTSGEP